MTPSHVRITRVACGYRITRDTRASVRASAPYSATERAWFRRALAAAALALALACGGTARAQARVDAPNVASAKREIATARAHLKDARATERAHAKESKREAKIAKLRSALAKLAADTRTSEGK